MKCAISVVVPVYNVEPYLERCIESILAQSFQDFELILVNDGSTDNSPALCREYCRKDVRVQLIDQENQGVSVARNRGIEESQGDWVVFVDSDDFISPDFLQRIAEEEPADLLIFDFIKPGQSAGVEAASKISIPLDNTQDKAVMVERLLRLRQLTKEGNTNLCSVCGKAYRRSLLEGHSIRFDSEIHVGEDILFNAVFFLTAQCCQYIPVPVYLYTARVGSAMHSFVPGLLQNFSAFHRKLKNALVEHKVFSLLEKTYTAKTLENMGYVLIKGIFHPHSENTARENRELCRQMREDEIYAAALRYNYRIGNLPRRIILGFFQLRCYWVVKILCRMCFFCIEQIDKRKEKR